MPAVAKVVVLGPAEAGKSTLVRWLCGGDAMNLAVEGRTVALDHGVLARAGRALSLVGVPGQARFACVREALVRGARGALWVVPSSSGPDFETAELLSSPALRLVPYFLLLNRRAGDDRGGEISLPADLRLPDEVVRLDLLHAEADRGRMVDALFNLVGGRE